MARLQNQYIFNEILDRLSGLASNIKLRASFNLLDSNVLSEDFYLGLLNLVYGWNLHNANSDVQNVQGIDLIDRNRKIVVQVTSTCTKQKLEHSLDKIPESCKGFHFYFLPIVDEEKKLRKGKYNPPFDVIFNPQSDILDNATILAKIKEEVNPDKLDAIYAYIRGCIQDGNPTPLVLASGLEYVITQIADSEIEEQEFDVTNFAIPAKVSFNNLSSTGKEVMSLEDLNTEEIFRKKLQKEKSRNTLASELGIVKSEIDELEKQKEQVCLNPEFDDEMSELSDLKYRITSLSAQLSSLKLRYSIMEEAKEEILSKKSDVDVATLKAIYKQAQRFVPDLHHTFEQLLEYHNSMLVRKADFIADELPTIENQIVKLETRIDELHKSEKVLSQKLTQSVSYVDYENLVTELTQKYERMGSLKQQIEQIDKVEERIERLKQKLADINGVLFTEEFKGKVQKQLDKLNFYLSRISQRLYGEQYGMVFEIQAAKNRTSEIFRFDVKRLDADTVNFSSGKKQGEIVCFDMAYILFADQEKIPCFHFGLYDKKELLHSNQLLKISTLLEENVNLQFVASILSDKLPKGLKNDRYIIVKLSQKDKLFKF
ncbi:MAG TPA: DUF2326 domain-containing protein [Prevotella sp.]|nr:DUF2326 domain-containing protein [Prevotella sp.]